MTYKDGAFFMKGDSRKISIAMATVQNLVGWKFDKYNGWFTTKVTSAFLLRDHADDKAKNILIKSFIQYTPFKEALVIPKGLKLLPHQPGSIKYALSRNRSYLGLAPGLGKTPIAAVIAATMKVQTLSIVPAGLALNTLEEYQKWAPEMSVGIFGKNDWIVPDISIMPDSLITRPVIRDYIRWVNPKLIIVDEMHRFKELSSTRTKNLLGYTDRRKNPPVVPGIFDARELQRLVVMSGTPMPNRPMELFPMLKKMAPQYIDFADKETYGMKYCDGYFNDHGYDYTGANVKEFTLLRNKFVSRDAEDPNGFMLKLDKSILKLPPLTEELVILGDDMNPQLRNADISLLRKISKGGDLMKLVLSKGKEDEFHISTYRRMLGMHKVKPSAAYIKSILEETDEKLLIFGVHIEAMGAMALELEKYDPLTVTGKVSKQTRHNMVKEFQTNKNKRIFQGNIDAVGVGLTLTKANRAIFFEWSWVPGVNRQAIDRGHRYGLEHPFLAQFLAFRNSLDKNIYETNERKKKITGLI